MGDLIFFKVGGRTAPGLEYHRADTPTRWVDPIPPIYYGKLKMSGSLGDMSVCQQGWPI
jgi:hypothetical protein